MSLPVPRRCVSVSSLTSSASLMEVARLKDVGCELVYSDVLSGTRASRPQWDVAPTRPGSSRPEQNAYPSCLMGCLGGRSTPTAWQESGRGRHLKFYETRGNLDSTRAE